MASAPVMVFLAGILASNMAPSESLATLPFALMIVGSALGTLPAGATMKRFGRRTGFILAELISIAGAALAWIAVEYQHFGSLLAGAICLGIAMGFFQQGRFAAIESLEDKSNAPKVVSYLMLSGVIGAIAGPEVAFLSKDLFSMREYGGSFLILGIFHIVGMAIFCGFKHTESAAEAVTEGRARPLKEFIQSPPILIAILAGIVAYGVMSFIMTATPNSMHSIHGHDMASTKWVIQSHLAAMFLPSLFTGTLVKKYGEHALMLAGVGLMLLCIIIGLAGVNIGHFFASLVLLGIAWNLLFVSGTSLLSKSYRQSERFSVQATNDFVVFSIQAAASLSAGWILFQIGWNWVLIASIPALVIMVAAIFWSRRLPVENVSMVTEQAQS